MIYDFAIVGAGVSGAVCAYLLSKQGKKCIVFEKNTAFSEKVCGGGISYKAIMNLNNIGIKTEPLFLENSKCIGGHIIRKDDCVSIKTYGCEKMSLGIQRSLFDSYLIKCAVQEGAKVYYEHPVNVVKESEGIYSIFDYYAKRIIWSIGARTYEGKINEGQSIGYSGQIVAKSSLKDNYFHYWYYDNKDSKKYFWAFPIGDNLWNVGIWCRHPFEKIKSEYNMCLRRFFLATVIDEWFYLRKPRAEFLGHIDQRKKGGIFEYGIGDYAGLCNPDNGGGIIQAIESATEIVKNDLCRL